MLPVELQTPREVALGVARRAKTLRLERGLTQDETAARTGVSLSTYQRFEKTGSITLERLVRLAAVLDARAGFDQLFALPAARSLAELEQRAAGPTRKRGRRRDAKA